MTTAVQVTYQAYPVDFAIASWLYAKANRTGSIKTRESYQQTIDAFRAALQTVGLDLDSDTRAVATVAGMWASRDRHGEREVSANSYNQRLAVLSSFYAFASKRGMLDIPNPIATIDRRPVQDYASARPLSPKAVRNALNAINVYTLEGARDYALLTVALQTGRRAAELVGLRTGDLRVEDDCLTIRWAHCKGGKVMYDRLSVAASGAVLRYLYMVYGAELGTTANDSPVWISCSRNAPKLSPIGTQALADICLKHLGTSKVHATRHSFAVSLEQAGAPVSLIQSKLGHSSLAVTGRYLAALSSDDNPYADTLSQLWGIE